MNTLQVIKGDLKSNQKPNEFFSLYFDYVSNAAECPLIYHRWAALSGIAALISSNIYFTQGHFKIFPNLYVMLMGSPGARKSTSIKLIKSILKKAGYENFSANKTTKEKFLLDLSDRASGINSDILEMNLFGESINEEETIDIFIAADEFNNFIGYNNIGFISLLGELWDYEGVFSDRIKNSKSIAIPNPLINILGGNTHQSFNQCFPPEMIGQGFLSRLLLIFGESTGKKVTFMEPPNPQVEIELINYINEIKSIQGEIKLTNQAKELLESIYHHTPPLQDPRFESYSTRRLTQLIKLIIICAASNLSLTVTEHEVLLANTILTNAEYKMPRALGEFGRARNSAATHKIVETLEASTTPLTIHDLWKVVSKDLERPDQLVEILQSLRMAGKTLEVPGQGILIKKEERKLDHIKHTIDFSLLMKGEV